MKTFDVIKEGFIVTVFSLLAFFLLTLIPFKKKYFKVLPGGADVEIYDIVFAGSEKPGIIKDSNIVLVELGNDRNEIADQLNILNKYAPRVIGIDAFFSDPGDPLENVKLEMALTQKNNVILSSTLIETDTMEIDEGIFCEPVQMPCGYNNFNAPTEISVVRSYFSHVIIDHKKQESFSSLIVKLFDSTKYHALQKRKDDMEMINYTANLENFFNISREQLLEYDSTGQLDRLNGKIILMGFFKSSPPLVLEDLHFTPMNPLFSGKSFPDMYGVVIHANIISMILNGKYINMAGKWLSYLYAFVITFLFSLFIIKANVKSDSTLAKRLGKIQYLFIVLVGYLLVMIFKYYKYKVFLEPIVVSMVLSLLFLNYYKRIAQYLHKKFNFNTVFKPTQQ